MNILLRRAAAVGAVAVLAVLPFGSAASGSAVSGSAAHAQRRQLAVTTLSGFKVVLTATREPAGATVTTAGYRHTAGGWKLIATKRIGKPSQWSWYATEVCSLTATQLKPLPSSAANADTLTVSLLWSPAIGCLGPYTSSWRP
jgi:hypothetical protein